MTSYALELTENEDSSVTVIARPSFAPELRMRVMHTRWCPPARSEQFGVGSSRPEPVTDWWIFSESQGVFEFEGSVLHTWHYGCFSDREQAVRSALDRASAFLDAYSVPRHA